MTDTASTPQPNGKKAQCASCGGERNCDVLGFFDNRGGDEFMSWSTEWYLLRCRGCEHVFVKTVGTNSEEYDHYYEDDGSTGTHHHETINYWPALTKRPQPDWLNLIRVPEADETTLLRALNELYTALNNDLRMLSGIAIRTAFDAASELLGVDPRLTFKLKLEALVAADRIGKIDLERLQALVDAGSASAHRGWQPSSEDLESMMELLEHFLHEAFVAPEKKRRLDSRAAKIRENVPVRTAKPAQRKVMPKPQII